ncbi:MAG: 6-phosphogluconolactonase [Armatimonadota bacterium]|nr:6-phosphogluconolactonase [Armatimonadota bacterium]
MAPVRRRPGASAGGSPVPGRELGAGGGGCAAGARGAEVALSGGRTPRRLYELLAEDPRIPWPQIEVFWGDERYVPPGDPRSNAQMAREALLGRIAIPPENVHPMPTHFGDPEDAARAYETILRAVFGRRPRFDLVLLGMGSDGHIASLSPGSSALPELERWVVAVWTEADPPVRLTLTLAAINQARRVDVLATGAEKRQALRRALRGSRDPVRCPASGVRPRDGVVVWWVDRAADEGWELAKGSTAT